MIDLNRSRKHEVLVTDPLFSMRMKEIVYLYLYKRYIPLPNYTPMEFISHYICGCVECVLSLTNYLFFI